MQSIDSGKGIAIKYLKEHLGKENGNTIHTVQSGVEINKMI